MRPLCRACSVFRPATRRMRGARFGGVSVSILAANSFASSTVACECAGVSPVSTFTGVSVSSVNRTSSKVCVPRIASGSTRSRETGRPLRSSNHEPTAGLTHSDPENSSCHEADRTRGFVGIPGPGRCRVQDTETVCSKRDECSGVATYRFDPEVVSEVRSSRS